MQHKSWQYIKAQDIEKRSFEIIRGELERDHSAALAQFDKKYLPVLIRIIHTTADFSWVDTFRASADALRAAVTALRNGANIVTDTKMAEAGIDKKRLAQWGGIVRCFMPDADVAAHAKESGTTRAAASMDKTAALARENAAAGKTAPFIFAIGNAPTALARLCELAATPEAAFKPAFVIGMPVGFVNVVESKEILMDSGIPYITAAGRKGGSNVAAAICNALLRLAEELAY